MSDDKNTVDYLKDLEQEIDALQARVRELEQKLAEWELAATQGHPQPCTLGPLCPYCRIRNLEEQLEMREQQVRDLQEENNRLDREHDYAQQVTIRDLERRLAAYEGGALHDCGSGWG